MDAEHCDDDVALVQALVALAALELEDVHVLGRSLLLHLGRYLWRVEMRGEAGG